MTTITTSDQSTHENYYDIRWAAEDRQERPPNSNRVRRVVEGTLAALRERRKPRILDVGCGNGWILQALRAAGGPDVQLYGIEPSSIGVENALRRVPTATIRTGAFGSDSFPFLFDAITCSEVIEHVPEKPAFVQALSDSLLPGGSLVLTTPNGRYRETFFTHMGVAAQPIEEWLTADELRELLEPFFTVRELTTFDLSYHYKIRPGLARARRTASCIRGGYRLWTACEKVLHRDDRRGLYLYLAARKQSG